MAKHTEILTRSLLEKGEKKYPSTGSSSRAGIVYVENVWTGDRSAIEKECADGRPPGEEGAPDPNRRADKGE